MSADDGWKMVEDELLAVARRFTRAAKVHQASYEAAVKAAKEKAKIKKERVAEGFGDVEEYVRANHPRLTRRHGSHRKKRRRGKFEDETDSDEVALDEEGRDILAGTKVGGLMERTNAKERELGGGRRVGTRAAAGFTRHDTSWSSQVGGGFTVRPPGEGSSRPSSRNGVSGGTKLGKTSGRGMGDSLIGAAVAETTMDDTAESDSDEFDLDAPYVLPMRSRNVNEYIKTEEEISKTRPSIPSSPPTTKPAKPAKTSASAKRPTVEVFDPVDAFLDSTIGARKRKRHIHNAAPT